jgi:hypothetical protein
MPLNNDDCESLALLAQDRTLEAHLLTSCSYLSSHPQVGIDPRGECQDNSRVGMAKSQKSRLICVNTR